jgi:hypothetical protein
LEGHDDFVGFVKDTDVLDAIEVVDLSVGDGNNFVATAACQDGKISLDLLTERVDKQKVIMERVKGNREGGHRRTGVGVRGIDGVPSAEEHGLGIEGITACHGAGADIYMRTPGSSTAAGRNE